MNLVMGKIDRYIEGIYILFIKGEGGIIIWFNLLIIYSKIYLLNILSLFD